jgi:Glycosyl transferase family 2
LVSVLLPVWNGERFLATAIDSLTAQTYHAFELLIIDDGSTDGSAAIVQSRAARDPRILLLQRPHAGIADALNAGIAAARGVYLARMDADDAAAPTRLARQVAYLDAHPACVAVGSAIEVIDAEGVSLGVVRFPAGNAAILGTLIGGGTGLAHPAVLMRRTPVVDAGGYRDQFFPSEDLDLWLRLRHYGEFENLGEPLLRYRRHQAAVGVRERGRQRAMAGAVTAEARAALGLRRWRRWHLPFARGTEASYHLECSRIALGGGEKAVAVRHARLAIASAPWWPLPYAALAACVVPARAVSTLARIYTRIATS